MKLYQFKTLLVALLLALPSQAAVPSTESLRKKRGFVPVDRVPQFDLPVTYNAKVRKWIRFFQTSGRHGFRLWLERSNRYLPMIEQVLSSKGMPKDLAYIAMIESGFSAKAVSHAQAVGYWQFIKSTANRYGLRTSWWLDERRDFQKSTKAAAEYLSDLYQMFDSWYLSAAAYNMGETRLNNLIKRHQTRNFWVLSQKPGFPSETRDYIPKLIASMLIAKAPGLYGFRNLSPKTPYTYDYFYAPGGTDLENLARFTGLNVATLRQLNPELVKEFIPSFVPQHKIRIPKGSQNLVSQYVRKVL